MIHGPKSDALYLVEFRTAAGNPLAISIPESESAVIKDFQERIPYRLYVPDVEELESLPRLSGHRVANCSQKKAPTKRGELMEGFSVTESRSSCATRFRDCQVRKCS
jgi:hypothetical protein